MGGGKNVGSVDTGDWMSYPAVTIPTAGRTGWNTVLPAGVAVCNLKRQVAHQSMVCLAYHGWAVGKPGPHQK